MQKIKRNRNKGKQNKKNTKGMHEEIEKNNPSSSQNHEEEIIIDSLSDEELEETFDPFSKGNCILQIFYIIIILGGLIFLILHLLGKI